MLTQEQVDNTRAIIDEALEAFGEKLRKIVREELARLYRKDAVKHEQGPIPMVISVPVEPIEWRDENGKPVSPSALKECGRCGEPGCVCHELHRHD